MKNLSGKTLIFYTFQQRKQLQYNVAAYQASQQPILIKDVIEQLPLNLSEGRYHFRFKSEFFQGNQKISGWIDISNLMAKVPLVGGSIYVKILKVKSNAHNKMFNVDKLTKVGLGTQSKQQIIYKKPVQVVQKSKNVPSQEINKPVSPISTNKPKQMKQNPVQKPVQPKNNGKSDLTQDMEFILHDSKGPEPVKTPVKSANQISPQVPTANIGEDFLQFEKNKVFVSEQTTEQKLAFFKQQMQNEQIEKNNEAIARDQLQEKIKKWGYSGAKTINNLTTLLSTLHDIWPEWPSISLTELLKPEDLAIHTKKALIKTHPDKNRSKPFKEKYLSKRVFELLNEAKKAAASTS